MKNSKKIKMILIMTVLFAAVILFGLGIVKKINNNELKILIVGDSISEGSGASSADLVWYKKLIPYMKETYGVKLDITNVSMGGTRSYAGYVRLMELDDEEDYDLAIICYGENDIPEELSLYYESILYTIRHKYPDCKLMTILESSQREYTDKIKTIQSLSEYYGAYVVDVIAAFNNSGRAYEELCNDGTHPNDEGQKVYYEAVKPSMDLFYSQRETMTLPTVEAVNPEIANFDKFKYYSVNDFHKVDEYTYELETDISAGVLGVDYSCFKGENSILIEIGERTVWDKPIVWEPNFEMRFIEKIVDECEINSPIRITFSSKEQMEHFHGIILHNYNLVGMNLGFHGIIMYKMV